MNTFKSITIWIALIFLGNSMMATTIRPYPNLGEMAKATEAVVLVRAIENFDYQLGNVTKSRTALEILEVVKGDLMPGEDIFIQHLRQKIEGLERIIWGDLELEEGKSYFLFLDYNNNGYWQPKMLSYAAFEEDVRDGQSLLVPIGLGREVHVVKSGNGEDAEPLKVYKKASLLEMLRRVVHDNGAWNSTGVETNYAINSFEDHSYRMRPSHCTNLSTTPYARWQNLEAGEPTSQSLDVWYGSDANSNGDPGCNNEATQVANAISDLNTNYNIELINAGTHTFSPSCVGEDATDSEFIGWVNSNLGGARNIVIQFDDPCGEVPDLTGCNGTLAVGGLYWYSTPYTWNSETWRLAAYGYIIVNNGTGACDCSNTDYEIMITHEIGHCLNVGHIEPGNGMANMNPSCCNTIQPLDVECLEFMYGENSSLPVELIGFDGIKNNSSVKLEWKTASEVNNDYFLLERSIDGLNYEVVGAIDGEGNSSTTQEYNYTDDQPRLGNNYYRLTQVDFNGQEEIFEKIVKISFEGESYIQVVPNPVTNDAFQLVYQSEVGGEVEVEIYNITGQRVFARSFRAHKARNLFNLAQLDLNEGAYVIRTIQGDMVQSLKFVKSN